MNRKDFLQTLELVSPALAQENLVPMYQNFCFKAGMVYAYRDSLGIIGPSTVDDEFAVHGKTLIELIRATNAKEIDIELQDESVLVKAGRSKIKLPFSPAEEFLFNEPEKEQWDVMLDIDKYFLKGLQLCLAGSANDNTMPALMGVSVAGGANSYLYSCDGDSISRYQLDGLLHRLKNVNTQYTMPSAFCDALLKVTAKTGHHYGQLYVNGQWVIAELGNAFRIFGRIIENPEPLKFEVEINKTIKKDRTPEYISIPSTMGHALNRARIIGEAENKATEIKMEANKMILTTETHMGVVRDVIPFKGEHTPLEVKVNAKLMSRAIGVTIEFAMLENCTLYRLGDDFFMIMSNIME